MMVMVMVIAMAISHSQMTAMYEVETMCRAEAWMKANLVPLVHKQKSRVRERDYRYISAFFLASDDILQYVIAIVQLHDLRSTI